MATVLKPKPEPFEDGEAKIAPLRSSSPSVVPRVVLLLLSVLLCAMLGSNYYYQSRLHQQLNYYPYHWKINWIQSPFPNRDLACFRKVIYVDGPVDNAYIAVAGDNFYKLTVNRSPVSMFFHAGSTLAFQPGSEPSPYTELGMRRHSMAGSIFNIAKQLQPGLNVIAVIAESDEDKAPRIAVQGEVTTSTTQEIVSDGSWKCWPQEESQAGIFWNQPPFRDFHWQNAQVTDEPVTSYVDGDPSVLTDPLSGYYITTPQTHRKAPIFLSTTIDCPPGDNQGYLRLGWTSTYDLLVNGKLVASTSMSDRYGVGIVKATGADVATRVIRSTGGNNALTLKNQVGTDVYEFQNLFHPGRNTLEVTLHGLEVPTYWTIPQLYMDGKIESAEGRQVRFQTDSNWVAKGDIDAPVTAPLILRQPTQLNTNAVIGKSTARSLASDMSMYRDLTHDGGWLFAILMVICLLVGFAGSTTTAIIALTRAAACVMAPVAFMICVMIVQWIFAFSPQNRYFAERSFGALTIEIAFVLFIINAVGVFLATVLNPQDLNVTRKPSKLPALIDQYGFAVALGVVMVGAIILYFHGLGHEAFIPDEYVSMLAATGITHRGIPIYENSGILYPRSSLYHYILAGFLLIARSQHNLVWARVPSVLWGLALIPLVYVYGRELRSKYVGLAAATAIAFSPYMEYFAREVRFYSQLAFFATLLFYMLLRAVRNPDQHKYRVGTILAFIGAYLSQQIIMGIIPAIVVVLLYSRQLRSWLEWKTLRWLILAATVIALDLGAYFIWCVTPLPFVDGMAEPLLGLHSDYLDTLPSLLLAYVEREQLVIGMLFVGGFFGAVWLMLKRRGDIGPDRPAWPWWKYQYLVVPWAMVVSVSILPHAEPRYVCELFPVITLSAICVAASMIAQVGRWMTDEAAAPSISRAMQVVVTIGIAALLIAEARPVRSYNETGRHINRDLTSACEYIRKNMQPGDKLMAFTPEVPLVEFGRCDYSWRPVAASLDKYISKDGRLRERNSGAVVIDSPDKLRKIMAREKRIWLIVSPMFAINGGDTGRLAQANFTVAYQDFGAEVFLWDRGAHRYYESIADHHRDQFDF